MTLYLSRGDPSLAPSHSAHMHIKKKKVNALHVLLHGVKNTFVSNGGSIFTGRNAQHPSVRLIYGGKATDTK